MTKKDGKIVKGSYSLKIIETNNNIEVWKYNKPIFNSYFVSNGNRKTFSEMTADEKIASLKRRNKYYKNKRWDIKRLIDANYDDKTTFLTLTFRDNITDYNLANIKFKYFIDRLKRYLKNHFSNFKLKYLATAELQNGKRREDKKGRNVWHFHCLLFSFPYIPASILEDIWGNGFLKVNKIDFVEKDQKALYITKYFTKDLDLKMHKKKSYYKSRNLKQPDKNFYFPVETDRKLQEIKNKYSVSYEKKYNIKSSVMGDFYDNSVEYYVFKK